MYYVSTRVSKFTNIDFIFKMKNTRELLNTRAIQDRKNGGIFYDLINTIMIRFDNFRFTRGACVSRWFSVIRINKTSIVSSDKDIYRKADYIERRGIFINGNE